MVIPEHRVSRRFALHEGPASADSHVKFVPCFVFFRSLILFRRTRKRDELRLWLLVVRTS